MKTNKHKHEYSLASSEKVAVCGCGRFQFTEKQLKENPPIVEQRSKSDVRSGERPQAERTPTPWTLKPYEDPKANWIASGENHVASWVKKEDAEFIIRAVNEYDVNLALIKHLTGLVEDRIKEKNALLKAAKFALDNLREIALPALDEAGKVTSVPNAIKQLEEIIAQAEGGKV